MAYPTAGEVCDRVRVELADQDVSGGNIFTNEKIMPHVQRAVREIWLALENIQAPAILRTRYFVLKANTISLDIDGSVSSMSSLLPDIKEPLVLFERSDLTQYTITAVASVSNGLRLTTSAAHGRSTGDRITVGGLLNTDSLRMGGDGMYAVTVVDTTNLTANGMHARKGGTYSSGGVAIYSANEFRKMRKMGRIERQITNTSVPGSWAWEEDRLQFLGSDVDRQIKAIYQSSATIPEQDDDTIAVNNSLDFLGVLAAAYATRIRMPNISDGLIVEALGARGQRDGSGGLLRDLMLPINNATQLDRDKQRPPVEFPSEFLSPVLRQT